MRKKKKENSRKNIKKKKIQTKDEEFFFLFFCKSRTRRIKNKHLKTSLFSIQQNIYISIYIGV